MSNEILSPDEEIIYEMSEEIARLQAENAALRAVPAEGDVMVPRELVRLARGMMLNIAEESDSKRGAEKCFNAADALRACLDAPQPRVLKAGDTARIIIPAAMLNEIVADADLQAKVCDLFMRHFQANPDSPMMQWWAQQQALTTTAAPPKL